jgi:hypothetical protein
VAKGRRLIQLVKMRLAASFGLNFARLTTWVKMSACGYMSQRCSSTLSPPRICTSQ